MRQVVPFNISKAGTTKYLCLKNVRLGYGIGVKYEYALLDWQNNLGKHANRNFPAGVSVPVYWNWTGTVGGVRKNWGHIGVRLADGRIWTDGRYYANIDQVGSQYLSGATYLGWGESVNGVRVVENVIIPSNNGGNMSDRIKNNATDRDFMRIINSEIKGWDFTSVHNGSLDAREMGAWVGQPYTKAVIQAWQEGEAYRNLKNRQAEFYNKYNSIIGSLEARPTKAQLEEVIAKMNLETARVQKAEAKALAEELKAIELAEQLEEERAKEKGDSEDTKLLDNLFGAIKGLIARFKNKE